MKYQSNRRILLVDDTESIHGDFRKILAPGSVAPDFAALSDLMGLPERPVWQFELDSAYQGAEALALVQASVDAGCPYAMAFVDMRMPPGWDGIETVERLWEADPRLQVVICTAYSDHPWEDVLERLDAQDRLLILKKPFDVIEVSQLARALTAKWSLARQAEVQAREQERTLQRLRVSESELRYTTQELQAFADAVSHDLQSPVAVMGSFSKLLAEELAGCDGKALHYLQRIEANSATAQDLITGLLTLTHISRSELWLEEVDLGALVQDHLAELRDAAPQRSICARVPAGLTAWADPRLIGIALRNLVENAWKFSAARDPAVIEVGLAQETAAERTFYVRDNGCGFDMAEADKLFSHFRRLHDPQEYPGNGVGLVTVGRVLARHAGRAWCASTPGRGSTFFFSIPCRPARAGRAAAQEA